MENLNHFYCDECVTECVILKHCVCVYVDHLKLLETYVAVHVNQIRPIFQTNCWLLHCVRQWCMVKKIINLCLLSWKRRTILINKFRSYLVKEESIKLHTSVGDSWLCYPSFGYWTNSICGFNVSIAIIVAFIPYPVTLYRDSGKKEKLQKPFQKLM